MKDIENFEGKYAVTEDGKVWSYKSEKYLKQTTSPHGYKRVMIDGKWRLVHRLVLETFKPLDEVDRMLQEQENFWECDHIDCDKSNNCISNLRWVDRASNMAKVNDGRRGMKAPIRKIIDLDTGKTYDNALLASLDVGVSRQTVLLCCHGSIKTAGGHRLIFEEG